MYMLFIQVYQNVCVNYFRIWTYQCDAVEATEIITLNKNVTIVINLKFVKYNLLE